MRSDRYMKKNRKGKGKCSNEPIHLFKRHAISAMMKNIAKIDWSNPYKDFNK
jgi:hypothetical protein